jgi:hypothetical protein
VSASRPVHAPVCTPVRSIGAGGKTRPEPGPSASADGAACPMAGSASTAGATMVHLARAYRRRPPFFREWAAPHDHRVTPMTSGSHHAPPERTNSDIVMVTIAVPPAISGFPQTPSGESRTPCPGVARRGVPGRSLGAGLAHTDRGLSPAAGPRGLFPRPLPQTSPWAGISGWSQASASHSPSSSLSS